MDGKILAMVFAFLAIAGGASGYESFVVMEVGSLTCTGCTLTSPEGLYRIDGVSYDEGIGISTSPDCSVVEGAMRGPASIAKGKIYSSAAVELNAGQQYYFCLKLDSFTKYYSNYEKIPSLQNGCGNCTCTASTNTFQVVRIHGAECPCTLPSYSCSSNAPNMSYARIDPPLVFAFPFTARGP